MSPFFAIALSRLSSGLSRLSDYFNAPGQGRPDRGSVACILAASALALWVIL